MYAPVSFTIVVTLLRIGPGLSMINPIQDCINQKGTLQVFPI